MGDSSVSLSLDDLIEVEIATFDGRILCRINGKNIYVGDKVSGLDKSYLIGYHLNNLDAISGDYEELLSKMNEFKSIFDPIVLVNLNGKLNIWNLSGKLIYVDYRSKKGNERFNLY